MPGSELYAASCLSGTIHIALSSELLLLRYFDFQYS